MMEDDIDKADTLSPISANIKSAWPRLVSKSFEGRSGVHLQ